MKRLRDAPGASTPLVLGVLVVLVTLAANSGSEALQRTVAENGIILIAVVGFYIFVGNSGVFSFGHICFMVIGAYAGSLAAMTEADKLIIVPELPHFLATFHTSPFAACLVGGAVAATVAAVLAFPLMRLNGISAALTSFAVLQIIHVVAGNWTQVTGGQVGLAAVPMEATVTVITATAVVAIAIAYLFQTTRWGIRLRASREDPVAAEAVGIRIKFERRLAFTLSAFVVGVAGALYAQFLGSITAESLYIPATFLLVAMLIVGGQSSLSGAVVGAIFVSIVRELLRRLEAGSHVGPVWIKGPAGMTEVGLALILIGVLIVRPAGLTMGKEITVASLKRLALRVRRVIPARAAAR